MSDGGDMRPMPGNGATPQEMALAQRIAKLNKINAALMQRVERSMDQQANAYSLFQTAIGLESQVRMRTEELKLALVRLERTNEELVGARDEAERANRFKTRFFTAVGHDLLQPLHAARLSLSALAEQDGGRDHERLANQVDHALSTIEELLRTLLDISKLEAGVMRPKLQAVPIGDVFHSLVTDIGPVARARNLSLTFRETTASVMSDPLMMRRILQNLIANAVHYTERGEIKLLARRRGCNIRIEVWDTGPGISPSEQKQIFEEFQRGSSSERTGANGFGLGLSIVQRMADALGHRIQLCSKLGHGTCFSVLAPFAGRWLPAQTLDKPSARLAYGFSSARVVVIDNDDAVLRAMGDLLTSWSCAPVIMAGLDDIERLTRDGAFRPDLVLADFHLDQGHCGLDAIARLRDHYGQELPAVVITADHGSAIADQVRMAGCELLTKPVRPAELRALIQHMLG